MVTQHPHRLFDEIARLRRECAGALLGSRSKLRLASRALADAEAALDRFDEGVCPFPDHDS
jgi:hypothetical protein